MGALPVVLVRRAVRRGAVRTVAIRCPLCGSVHIHGWPLGRATVGTRVSHCHRPSGEPTRSYVFVVGPEVDL